MGNPVLTSDKDPSDCVLGQRIYLVESSWNREEYQVQNDIEVGEDGPSVRELHPTAAFLAYAKHATHGESCLDLNLIIGRM